MAFAACECPPPTHGNGLVPAPAQNPLDVPSSPLDAAIVGPAPTLPIPSEPGTIIAEPVDEAAYVFDQTEVRTYDIQISPENLATLNQQPSAEQYVEGSLMFEGQLHGPVGVRYKGSVGAFLPPCTSAALSDIHGPKAGKCSFKLGFDWQDPNARFFGLKKLNLHSMSRDASLLRDRLAYALFREFGLAASRAAHARVLINGQLEGLFAVVEEVDGRFTRTRFSEGGAGNLYKEVWPIHGDPNIYLAALETNTDEMPSAQRFVDFKNAIDTGIGGVEAWLDRQTTVDYLAADRVMINDDGALHFWCSVGGQGNNPGGTGNHNYFWYEAEQAARFWLIPWDMDSSLKPTSFVHITTEWRQPGSCSCADAGYRAPSCDPLVNLWARAWSADYEAAVDRFLAGPFSAPNVAAKLDFWQAQIRATVAESAGIHGAPPEADWDAAVLELRAIIDAARANRGYMY